MFLMSKNSQHSVVLEYVFVFFYIKTAIFSSFDGVNVEKMFFSMKFLSKIKHVLSKFYYF